MDSSAVIQLVILLILIILSAFFSSAETALSTVNRVRMRALEEEGNRRAARVNQILDNYGKMISTILIGNNIVNISASSLAARLLPSTSAGLYRESARFNTAALKVPSSLIPSFTNVSISEIMSYVISSTTWMEPLFTSITIL